MMYMSCVHKLWQSRGFRACQPSSPRAHSLQGLQVQLRYVVVGSFWPWWWTPPGVEDNCAVPFKARGPEDLPGGCLRLLLPFRFDENSLNQGPLRGFAVALSPMESVPSCVSSSCSSLFVESTTDPTSHVSEKVSSQPPVNRSR